MFYSEQISVFCPVGYVPITRPKDWTDSGGAYGRKAISFMVTIKESFPSINDYLENISTQLSNFLEIETVLISQLARCPVNDFRIALSDEAKAQIQQALGDRSKNSNPVLSINLSSKHIYLFQRKSASPLH